MVLELTPKESCEALLQWAVKAGKVTIDEERCSVSFEVVPARGRMIDKILLTIDNIEET